MAEFDQELDASGLNCPMPILRTKKALKGMSSAEVLKVIATDPASENDMEAFCRQAGHTLLQTETSDEKFLFLIEKA